MCLPFLHRPRAFVCSLIRVAGVLVNSDAEIQANLDFYLRMFIYLFFVSFNWTINGIEILTAKIWFYSSNVFMIKYTNERLNNKTRWLNNGNNIDDIEKITGIQEKLNTGKGITHKEDSWRDKRLRLFERTVMSTVYLLLKLTLTSGDRYIVLKFIICV